MNVTLRSTDPAMVFDDVPFEEEQRHATCGDADPGRDLRPPGERRCSVRCDHAHRELPRQHFPPER